MLRYQGTLFRALNPRWACEPLSGEGARRHGGRFNPRGVPALYTSTDVLTAVREANQAGALQPTVLVSYEADLEPVLDGRDPAALAAWDATPEMLAAPDWRVRMRSGEAPTQSLARRLIEAGIVGLLVPSYARGAEGGINLVLWRWGPERPARLSVIDDEGRLG